MRVLGVGMHGACIFMHLHDQRGIGRLEGQVGLFVMILRCVALRDTVVRDARLGFVLGLVFWHFFWPL